MYALPHRGSGKAGRYRWSQIPHRAVFYFLFHDLSLSPVLGLFPPRGFFPDDARMDDPSPMWRRRDGLSLRLPPKSTKDEFEKSSHQTKVRKLFPKISDIHIPPGTSGSTGKCYFDNFA